MKDFSEILLSALTKASDSLDLRLQVFSSRRVKAVLNYQSFCYHSRNFVWVNSKF